MLHYSIEPHTIEHYYADDVNATNVTAMALRDDPGSDSMMVISMYPALSTAALRSELVRLVYTAQTRGNENHGEW